MKNAISIIGMQKCTGCFGCQNVCAFGAISMPLDSEGFYKPLVDDSKCTECDVCVKRCPVINYTNPNQGNPECYAGWSMDDSIRMGSSSGGVFSELARHVIEKESGVVFGVRWNDGVVEHACTETIEGLVQLRGSKYLPSHVGDAYNQVKRYIKDGRKVLFVGVPCQVAALRNIVKSDNLILVDLACLGVPSISVYRKYIAERFKDRVITHTKFRSKTTGWKTYSVEYWHDDELVESNINSDDTFFYGFSPECLYDNQACYECKFNAIPRCGDITLADYWGVPKEFDSPKGVSAIFVNNDKSSRFLANVEIDLFPQPLERILAGNPRLNKSVHIKMPKNRICFFSHLEEKSFEELVNLYFSRSNKLISYVKNLIVKIINR